MRSFDQIISRLRQKSSAPTFAVFGLIDMFMKTCRLPDLHQVYKRETIAHHHIINRLRGLLVNLPREALRDMNIGLIQRA